MIHTTYFIVTPEQIAQAGGRDGLGDIIDSLAYRLGTGILEAGLYSGDPVRIGVQFDDEWTDLEKILAWLEENSVPIVPLPAGPE